jgi:hypothetical protein
MRIGPHNLTERGGLLLVSALGTCGLLEFSFLRGWRWWRVRQSLHGILETDSGQSKVNGFWHKKIIPQFQKLCQSKLMLFIHIDDQFICAHGQPKGGCYEIQNVNMRITGQFRIF